jgi:penicillin amidase/acyl-homoserine-lactone acylase
MAKRRVWAWIAAALAVAVLGAAWTFGVRWAPALTTPFDAEGALTAAKSYDAVIRRDAYGVPRVWGKSDADAAFALAYAHAEDDFATIQESLANVRGPRLVAETETEARTAYLYQAFGVEALVNARYETDVPQDVRALLEGYAAGLNYYAALHPQTARPGLFPIEGQDIVKLASFMTPLFYGMSGTLNRLLAPDKKRTVGDGQGLRVDLTDGPIRLARGDDAPDLGSNGFAVAPSRASDGATRLIVNSHQPVSGPLAWYETHMTSTEGLNFAGGTFPGSPLLYVGANEHVAFTATTNRPDVIDVYELVVDDAKRPTRYRLDGAWQPLEQGKARMRVRLWGPIAIEVQRPTLRSRHGPVLVTPRGVFAVRYATMDDLRYVEQTYRAMKAKSLDELEQILRMNAQGNQNRIVADSTGAIGRFYVAKMPRRTPGPDYRAHLPGDRSDLIWTEFEPFEALPHVVRPQAGFVVEANSAPWRMTDGPDDLDKSAFPETFGIETVVTNRQRRAVTLFSTDASISREELIAYKFDHRYDPNVGLTSELRAKILATDWGEDPDLAAGRELIAQWDFALDPENRSAALAIMTMQPIGAALYLGAEPPTIEESFKAAVATLKAHYGRLDVPWAAVNRIKRGAISLPLAGGPDTLRSAQSELDPDGTLRMVTGDGLVMLVEWDAQGRQQVWSVHHFGASQNPASPHYADQMPLFVTEGFKRVPMTEPEIEAAAARRYRPGEESPGRP